MQPPIRIRNSLWLNLAPLTQIPLVRPRYIDHAIDDRVRDMDALGPELSR